MQVKEGKVGPHENGAWNVGQDTMKDEDIKIDIPGQEEEVRIAFGPEERGIARRIFQIRSADVRRWARRRVVQGVRRPWAEEPTETTQEYVGNCLRI